MKTGRPDPTLLRWLLSPGRTAPASRRPAGASSRDARTARLAGAHLLRRMDAPLARIDIEEGLAGWLTSGRHRVDADLLWLGAWLSAQALRRNTGSACCSHVAGLLGPQRFVRALKHGARIDVPGSEPPDAARLRAIGLAAMHAYLCVLSPALAARFLLDQPVSRERAMEEEMWVAGAGPMAVVISDVALWNRHEPTV